MSARSRAATVLAEHLTATAGVQVAIAWDNPSGRPGSGAWRVEWVDGPTVTTARALAAQHARWVRPLEVATLHYSRSFTPTAWAAALLAVGPGLELGLPLGLQRADRHRLQASIDDHRYPERPPPLGLGDEHAPYRHRRPRTVVVLHPVGQAALS
jgi:hypothetical protein